MRATYTPNADEPPYMRLVQDRVPEGDPIRPLRRKLCSVINNHIFNYTATGRQ